MKVYIQFLKCFTVWRLLQRRLPGRRYPIEAKPQTNAVCHVYSFYFLSFTASTTLYCLVTKEAGSKQVCPILFSVLLARIEPGTSCTLCEYLTIQYCTLACFRSVSIRDSVWKHRLQWYSYKLNADIICEIKAPRMSSMNSILYNMTCVTLVFILHRRQIGQRNIKKLQNALITPKRYQHNIILV